MCHKAKKYSEETNPKQRGEYKEQDSNSNLPERRLCSTLLMINVEKVDVLVERSLEKFRWQGKKELKYECLQNFSGNVKRQNFLWI